MTKKKSGGKRRVRGRPSSPPGRAAGGGSTREVNMLRSEVARLQETLRETQEMLSIAPAFFGFLSTEGAVLGCNALALQAIEATPEQVYGRLFWEAPWWRPLPESAARIRQAVLSAAKGQSSNFDTEYWSITQGQGQKRWAAIGVSPVMDEQGGVARVTATGIDITERQLSEEALRRVEEHLRKTVASAEQVTKQLRQSEEHLRRIVEVTQVGAWEMDLITEELVADARFSALFGLPPGEHFPLSKRLALIHPEDSPRVAKALADAIAGNDGGRYGAEYRTTLVRNGQPQWVEARGQVSFGPDGKAVRFVGTGSDITVRKASEAALRVENERRRTLEALAEASEDLIAYAAPEGEILYLNPAGRRIVGLNSLEEACTKKLSDFFTPEARVVAEAEARPEMLAGRGWSGETMLRHFRTGESIPMHEDGMGLTGDDGKVVRVAAIMRDLRELKRQYDHERQRADFERQLIGMVSHDLRNPLNTILLAASVLGHEPNLSEQTSKFVVRIQSTAQRAGRMIRDLLDFTQARLTGNIPVNRQPVDLRDVVRTAVDEVQVAHPGKGIEVVSDGDLLGEWDGDRLIQVVQNLLNNALLYGSPDASVQVRSRAEEGGVVLSVRNAGSPIPADKLPSIFEPLQRATENVNKSWRSVGLGLYIVKHLVEAHGGTVSANSSAEAGTTFSVRLPRHATSVEAQQMHDVRSNPAQKSAVHSTGGLES
jgi:PAS domain S-box-containing protein